MSSPLDITHHIGVVESIADRVAMKRAGRIEEKGDCAAVLARPTRQHTKYKRTLRAALPRLPAP